MSNLIRIAILCFFTFMLIGPGVLAVTCEFSGWGIPYVEGDTLTIDGSPWIVTDTHSGHVYTRRIVDASMTGNTPKLYPWLQESYYLSEANNFLERNDDTLQIEQFGQLSLQDIGSPKTVDFRGVSQYCEGLQVIGSFAGAVEFNGDKAYAVASRWYTPITLQTLTPLLSPEEAGIEGDQEVKILPTDDGFVLVYESGDHGKKSYKDANTGNDLSYSLPQDKDKKSIKVTLDLQTIFLITMLVVLVFGAAYAYTLIRTKH